MYACVHACVKVACCMCTCMCVCACVHTCVTLVWYLKNLAPAGKASGPTLRDHLPLSPDHSLWPASPAAVLSFKRVLISAAPPTPLPHLWSVPGVPWWPGGGCPKNRALTCDVAEPQVAEGQNHPDGLSLPRGHAHLLGQMTFARMPNKLDALGNGDLHIYLQGVVCSHGAWICVPPSTPHCPLPTVSLVALSKGYALLRRPSFPF